jgi:ADP-ribosylglycohydrolase
VSEAIGVERVIGAILGGAIGDGWGGPFEGGLPRRSFRAPDELVVSDDTQLTLATCEALIEGGSVDPERIARRFVTWFRGGRLRGLGASTLKALRDLEAGAPWALAGAKGERSAGNGAAMRIAPLAFFLNPEDDADRRTLRDVCRITHHHDEAYVGALAVVWAMRLASRAEGPLPDLPGAVAGRLPDSQVRDRLDRYATFADDVTPARIADSFGSGGFVVDSVPLAVFAARDLHRRPFSEILRGLVEAGGDTDTIASMAGQIVGAAVGASGLPGDLIMRLRERDEIVAIATELARVTVGSSPSP